MIELLADQRMHPSFAHWLSCSGPRAKLFDEASMRFTFDGQGALHQLFRMLRPTLPADARVLVPAFHCPTVVEPVLRAGFPVDFYDVCASLRRPAASWASWLTPQHRVVLAINFFGFDFELEGLMEIPAASRPLIVEDCSHSFLAGDGERLAGGRGDYSVFSFKKLVPCVTGGAIWRKHASLPLPALAPSAPAEALWNHLRRVVVSSLSASVDAWRGRPEGRVMIEEMSGPVVQPPMAQVYPFVPALSQARMPALAKRILTHSDLPAVVASRRRLFARIAARLAPLREVVAQPFADDLKEACPWGFPLLIAERAQHDFRLRNRGVPFFTFGEQLHPSVCTELERFPNARRLRDSMLSLPVHQQLREDQVNNFCDRVADYFSRQYDSRAA